MKSNIFAVSSFLAEKQIEIVFLGGVLFVLPHFANKRNRMTTR